MQPNAGRNLKPGHILVLDDEPSCVQALSLILRRAGYDVCASSSVESSMQTILFSQRSSPVDLVLCDIVMGQGSGFQLDDRIRAEGLQIPVVFMTGSIEESVLQEVRRRGGRFLAKPFDPKTVVSEVNQAMVCSGLAATTESPQKGKGPL
jgi:DNA-binding NtrC family response regulator